MMTYNAALQVTNHLAQQLRHNKEFDIFAQKAKYEVLDTGHIFIWKGLSEEDSTYLWDLLGGFPITGYRFFMSSIEPYTYYANCGTLLSHIIETSFSIGKVKER